VLQQCEGRALDASADTQRAQQVPGERRLARAQRTLQRDERFGHRRARGQALCEGGAIGLVAPVVRAGF